MRIEASTVQFEASSVAVSLHSVRSRLQAWVGDRPPPPAASEGGAPAPSLVASISAAARAAAAAAPRTASAAGAGPASAADAIEQAAQDVENDPRMQLIRSLIALLTGREVRTLTADARADAAPAAAPAGGTPAPAAAPAAGAGFGLEFDFHEVRQEFEQSSFQAEGTVRTADGQQIAFRVSLQMQRSHYQETQRSLRLGDALLQDPLVLDFAGSAAQLTNQRFRFDLDGDGQDEDVPLLSPNIGYLALDLNGNGRIDSGRELFGPATGNGYAELAQHDRDGNRWIDAGDPVFERLQVWTPAADGPGTLRPLAASGIGALQLDHAATPFALRDADNRPLGAVRASSVYLREGGGAGTLQQIDLAV